MNTHSYNKLSHIHITYILVISHGHLHVSCTKEMLSTCTTEYVVLPGDLARPGGTWPKESGAMDGLA